MQYIFVKCTGYMSTKTVNRLETNNQVLLAVSCRKFIEVIVYTDYF